MKRKTASSKLAKAKHTRSLSQKVHAILRETWNGKVTFAVSRKRDAKSLYYIAASVGSENECLALLTVDN